MLMTKAKALVNLLTLTTPCKHLLAMAGKLQSPKTPMLTTKLMIKTTTRLPVGLMSKLAKPFLPLMTRMTGGGRLKITHLHKSSIGTNTITMLMLEWVAYPNEPSFVRRANDVASQPPIGKTLRKLTRRGKRHERGHGDEQRRQHFIGGQFVITSSIGHLSDDNRLGNSPNVTDPSVTSRVMTILRAEEY
jgi:hypothetical protein